MLISPILLYGSEIWEPYLNQTFEKWDSNAIEKVHLSFMKRILGVNRSTTNVLVRGELGRYSLKERCITRSLNYIKYLNAKGDTSLVKQAYNYELSKVEERTTFLTTVGQFNEKLDEIEGRHINIFQTSIPKLKKSINQVSLKEWERNFNCSTKSDTYRLFKNRPKLEKYLEHITDIRYVKTLTKFRLSDHKLMIEEGRKHRPKIDRADRLCPHCNNVEDEIHFLIDCNKYQNDRIIMYQKIDQYFPNFSSIDESKPKFIFLMSQENLDVTKIVTNYIHKWYQTRSA